MVMFISVEIDLIEHWGGTITIYILTMIILDSFDVETNH